MEYRAYLCLVNDDEDPSPESIQHLLWHLLRGEGLVTVQVEVRDDDENDQAGEG